MKTLWSLLRETFAEWSRHQAPRLAAALAYYTIFSLAPLLVILLAIAGAILGPRAAAGQIYDQVRGAVGPEAAQMIETMIESAARPTQGWIASLLGAATLLLGAAGLFGQLQASLNIIWEVPPAAGKGIWRTIRERLAAFLLVGVAALILLLSLVASAGIAAGARFLDAYLPVPGPALEGLDLGISFLIITVLFALIYRVLPDVRIGWRDVWLGAAVTAFLFVLGKFLLGLYLGLGTVGSTYGAAGSLVVLLVWLYYSAQILLLGAEFTRVYAVRRGSLARKGLVRPEPAPGALAPAPLLTPQARDEGRLALAALTVLGGLLIRQLVRTFPLPGSNRQ